MAIEFELTGAPDPADWTVVAVAYQRAIRSFDDFVKPILARRGLAALSVTTVLFLISIGDEPRKLSDLVRQERYEGSNAFYAVNALVDAGLIVRERDPRDKRSRIVHLTDAGRALLLEIRQVSAGRNVEVNEALSGVASFESHIALLPA